MRFRLLSVIILISALALAACGGSKHPKKSTSPSSSGPTTSSKAPESADAAAVRQLYLRFVDPKIPVAQKVDLLQDGADFRPAMEQQAASQYAKNVTIAITSVTVNSPKKATVVFDVLLSGSPVVRAQKGYAVKDGGHWQVAGVTFCGLLGAVGPVPAVCRTASATSLPD